MKFILTIYDCRLKGSAENVSKEVVEIDSSQSQGPRRSPRKHDKKRAPSKKKEKTSKKNENSTEKDSDSPPVSRRHLDLCDEAMAKHKEQVEAGNQNKKVKIDKVANIADSQAAERMKQAAEELLKYSKERPPPAESVLDKKIESMSPGDVFPRIGKGTHLRAPHLGRKGNKDPSRNFRAVNKKRLHEGKSHISAKTRILKPERKVNYHGFSLFYNYIL